MYGLFMDKHVCASLCVILCKSSSSQKQRVSEETDSVSLAIPVMSIKLGWLTGRVRDGAAGGDRPKAMGSVKTGCK